MQKLLIELGNPKDLQKIADHLAAETPFEIIMSANAAETEALLRRAPFQLILRSVFEFQDSDLEQIRRVRALGHTGPLLFVLDHLTSLAEQHLHNEHKLYFLEKPFELKTILGLTKKLMSSQSVNRQEFRRYPTDQMVSVESFMSGEQFESRMRNLSKGGAYLELTEKPHMEIGELLRVRIPLDQMGREHQIHGRLVWSNGQGNGNFGIGVQFIKTEEIYRQLLEKV